jgi:hypothetical protein
VRQLASSDPSSARLSAPFYDSPSFRFYDLKLRIVQTGSFIPGQRIKGSEKTGCDSGGATGCRVAAGLSSNALKQTAPNHFAGCSPMQLLTKSLRGAPKIFLSMACLRQSIRACAMQSRI